MTLIEQMRSKPKPRIVRAEPTQFESFIKANVETSSYVDLSKKAVSGGRNFNIVLIEMTPELQQFLKFVYSGGTTNG